MALSKRKRFDVFKRDKFACQYCGKRPPDVVLEVDHVHPVSKGGQDELYNLVTSCFDCNQGKRARLLDDIPASVSESQSRTIEKMEQTAAFNRFILKNRRETARFVKDVAEYWLEAFGHELDRKQLASVKLFISRLDVGQVLQMVDSTESRCKSTYMPQVFKYFCGCCWTAIRQHEQQDSE